MEELLTAISAYISRVSSNNLFVVAVQLLLIGSVVCLVMRFLRGTRGASLIKGVALLMAVVYVVIFLLPEGKGWDPIKFLYGKFLLFSVAAVVGAFQPELRRAFIQIGQARMFRSRKWDVQAMVESLTSSAANLARNKTGALIAIERRVGLGALVEAGTSIDAEISAALLNSVFYPGAALHDMGVIISDGRLAAAGCQFPLAESEEVDASLGSRHRAALGLSKECDAVVLVVSEETGRVSLACEGQLYLGVEMEDLHGMLMSFLYPSRAGKKANTESP